MIALKEEKSKKLQTNWIATQIWSLLLNLNHCLTQPCLWNQAVFEKINFGSNFVILRNFKWSRTADKKYFLKSNCWTANYKIWFKLLKTRKTLNLNFWLPKFYAVIHTKKAKGIVHRLRPQVYQWFYDIEYDIPEIPATQYLYWYTPNRQFWNKNINFIIGFEINHYFRLHCVWDSEFFLTI